VPCVDYSSVCVPAQAMQRGCVCALIRPGQEESARTSFKQMFGRRKRDAFDDLKFAILHQNGTDELNRFFSVAESVPAGVDNNVFAMLHTEVHTALMTVPKSLVNIVVGMQNFYISNYRPNQLLNCDGPRCEVIGQMTDLLSDSAPNRQNRKFRVARAVRYDIDNEDTLIAFTSATSDFFLNKVMVHWNEHVCKKYLFITHCKDKPQSREDLRVFDDATKINWMNHVNREMVGKFRISNANLLV
ncbi:hypothetical protein PENTCL1PPCAC_3297, partial [Pristionchus entomophagus]